MKHAEKCLALGKCSQYYTENGNRVMPIKDMEVWAQKGMMKSRELSYPRAEGREHY